MASFSSNDKTTASDLDNLDQDLEHLYALVFPGSRDFSEDKQKIIFEQYKLLMQSSEQLAQRRQQANGFFLSLNSFILGGVGFIYKESFEIYVHEHKVMRLMILAIAIALVGVVIDINWGKLISSYGKLMRAQIRVLEAMEKHVPASVVTAQVAFHRKDFHSLSSLEANIAHTFQWIYICAAVIAVGIMAFSPVPPSGPVPDSHVTPVHAAH